MADTGAPYFIPYVEPSDLVRNYPAASEDLADAIVAALEAIPVTIKKVDAFTGSGTFTVPAGVTYAIAHMLGGGGGIGTNETGSAGGASSVAFASGTVTSPGARRGLGVNTAITGNAAGIANTGGGAMCGRNAPDSGQASGGDGQYNVAGAAVTPAASITITVGAGGAAGTGGSAGGSGFVYIEYFEEA